jgi:predicted  nucleic acid-binding Zn-ribbon protein
MEHALSKIAVKPNDYFFCEKCGRLNWYDNENVLIVKAI